MMLTSDKIKNFIDINIFYGMLFLFLLLLSGCGSSTPKNELKSIKITLSASDDINPNDQGKAAPLNIFIYELKSVDYFKNSDYFSIYENTNPALKDEALKVYDAILQPGESRTLEITPGKDITSLGVIAAYREINKSNWSETVNLQKPYRKKSWWRNILPEHSLALGVHFNTLAISIDKMD